MNQKWLDYVFQRAPLLSNGCSQTVYTDRSAVESFHYRKQQPTVEPIKPILVDFQHIQSAVGQNADAGAALQRFASFETLFQSLDDDGELQSRVAEWAPGGRFGWVFDEPDRGQRLDLSGDIVGFDMTEILDMTTERMAVLSYIFRQIERVVEDRRPTIIVLDEAWKLLDDPYFGARLENWLVTLRKMNCVVIMMTQYPSQLRDSRVGKTIVETVPTQILFPNCLLYTSDAADE